MQDIKELSLKELEDKLLSWGSPKQYAQGIFNWIYSKGASEFSRMSNLPASLRKNLTNEFSEEIGNKNFFKIFSNQSRDIDLTNFISEFKEKFDSYLNK